MQQIRPWTQNSQYEATISSEVGLKSRLSPFSKLLDSKTLFRNKSNHRQVFQLKKLNVVVFDMKKTTIAIISPKMEGFLKLRDSIFKEISATPKKIIQKNNNTTIFNTTKQQMYLSQYDLFKDFKGKKAKALKKNQKQQINQDSINQRVKVA